MEVAPGTKIADRYVIERALAQGGMGAVYVATDTRMNARVALKITAAGGAAATGLARRFAREARIGHLLGSRRQGFVRASDWGRIDDVRLYLVMDLVDGARSLDLMTGTLDERLSRWRRAAELVRVAHEQGVIHRDLKPANFLQAPDGSIFLTDFGLAKVVGEPVDGPGEEVSITLSGAAFGTPPYMPPEQLEDAKHVDERADVFALGCMLFEAAVRRLPYPGPTPTGILSAHLKVRSGLLPAPRPRDVDATIAEAIDQACVQALELDVTRRVASVGALLGVLDGAPSSLSGVATAAPAAPTLSGTPTVQPARSTPPAPPSSGPRRPLAAVGALLVILVGAFTADVGGVRARLTAPGVTTELVPTTAAPPPLVTGSPSPSATRVALVELSPRDGAAVPALMIDVTGRIEPAAASVRVAGIACAVGADGTFTLARLSLEPGANRVDVEVRPEAADQEPIRRTLTITADPDDPRLAIETPVDGLETAAATVDLRGRVDDASAVEVSIDGELVARVKPGGGAFSALVELTAPGPRAIEVLACDAVGRESRLTRTVTRRAARLELTLDAPADGAETNAAQVRIAGRVTGDAAPGTLEVRVGEVVVPTDANGAFDHALPLPEGDNTLEIVATCTGPAGDPVSARARRRVRAMRPWTPGRPLPWSRGPARLPTGVVRGAIDGEYVNERDGSILVYVPPGTFRMGSDLGGDDEKPVHEVQLTRGYFIGKYEVTWAQYRAFCRAVDMQPPSNVIDYLGQFEASEGHPVFNVSWDDAQTYCRWAGLRLPSEAEWEYAARGSDGRAYPWGNEEPGTTRCNRGVLSSSDYRDERDGHLYTAPVGSFAGGASAFGALDMVGNVQEWVQDWFAGPYSAGAQIDPLGAASATFRVTRGGGWYGDYCNASNRFPAAPGKNRFNSIGLRVVRSADPDGQ